jgi:hypothetical protein
MQFIMDAWQFLRRAAQRFAPTFSWSFSCLEGP